MKTKVNEIPLVGPRGRSELIKKINETNKNTGSKFKVVEDFIADMNERLEKVEYETYKHIPFTIYSLGEGTLTWGLEQKTVQYSKNGGEWTTMNSESIIQLSKGDELAFKGSNTDYNGNRIVTTMNYDVMGNIMSLIDGDDYENLNTLGDNAFRSALFYNHASNHSDFGVVNAEYLVFPAMNIGTFCYLNMFRNCDNLVTAPKVLPAKTLAQECYEQMFANCKNLVSSPELPALVLAQACYSSMFQDCVSLTTVQKLPAKTLKQYCYRNMFQNCIKLETVLEFSATTLEMGCCEQMFTYCSSLKNIPPLLATTLTEDCYKFMFYGCSSLSYIKAMFTTTPGNSYTSDWINGVKATGTFVKNSAATWNVTGNNGVPSGWTVETANS